MATYPTNAFIDYHLPVLFWPAELAVHGTTVSYLPQGDVSQAVTISGIWNDGQSEEDVSPGRLTHIKVRNADLPTIPARGDVVQRNGKQYTVTYIHALIIQFSILVLDENGAVP